ncbi:MAG TPA: FkbM family methyltransferase [Gemmatimonadaceae bacterium]|nr:FkbM family methyltransferase [Gemmatimonadaceae bacterium]
MAIRSWLIERLPDRHRTRARYLYRALTGRLDPELAMARRVLRPGAGIADIGANTGLWTYAMGRTTAVDAFEPLPGPARVLRALATTLPAARVHEVALSNREGEATLYVPYLNGHPHSELARFAPPEGRYDTVVVPMRTLDSYSLRNVGLLKIDVEGHELAVLEGARQTIASQRPVLLIEIEQRHLATKIADTFAAIAAMGYQGSFVDHAGREHPIEDFSYVRDQEAWMKAGGDTPYVHNFLFVPCA